MVLPSQHVRVCDNPLINLVDYSVKFLGAERLEAGGYFYHLNKLMNTNLDKAVDYAKNTWIKLGDDELRLSDVIESYTDAVSKIEIELDGVDDYVSLVKILTLQYNL